MPWGGTSEAARLSGVPVYRVLIAVYAICGAMAGLAGIVDASRFEGGRPNAGELYELQVIAAVVVGGTSLAGGEGRVLGTLGGGAHHHRNSERPEHGRCQKRRAKSGLRATHPGRRAPGSLETAGIGLISLFGLAPGPSHLGVTSDPTRRRPGQPNGSFRSFDYLTEAIFC